MPHNHYSDRDHPPASGPGLGAILGVFLGAAGAGYLLAHRPARRPHDSAPARTAKHASQGRFAIAGRTVTIARPRDEVYAFWRQFGNLAGVMENVHAVTTEGEVSQWTLRSLGHDITLRTRITEDRPGEVIAWASTDESEIETTGRIAFRDAPGNRGTEVTAIIAYVPPFGALGRVVAKLFQADPSIQGRRELKRLKMFLETGEIATPLNRRQEA
ncbi:SRPBCC family protein [Paracoccus nototheniae]|uniref:SRPBCC family protein n=1 Tax=Paracoccus nototheniae TaxID=2489002 RepID=A0ABW4DTS3_9RHOB|nr:SRPBCC family protein [Paracoccus nototheniae]